MAGDTICRNLPQSKPPIKKSPPAFQLRKPQVNPTEGLKHAMEVQGSHRTLLSRQPLRKHVTSYPTAVVDLESSRKKVSFEQEAEVERKGGKEKPSVVITLPMKSERLATKATQTDFRESEAQTFPWKHEIQTEGKVLAELLSLDWFTLEKNFPPGIDEVTLIEKARQKLAWEKVIERLRGRENEMKRKLLVLRMTANETAFRERKKDEENRERLQMSLEVMREARRAFEEKLWMRLQRSYCSRKTENFSKINYWNHQLARNIRKAKSARQRPTGKQDIIAMHKDRTSDLYAPRLRTGKNPRHEAIDIRCRYLKRFHGLEILEKHMADILDPKLFESAYELHPKSKKLELSWRKFVTKVAEEPKEKKLASLSLKIAVPVPSPDPPTTRRTRPRSDSEDNLLPGTFLWERISYSQGDSSFVTE